MGRLCLIEYEIPTDPYHGFVYACINATCHNHFVSRLTPDFHLYNPCFHAIYFQERVVNLVTCEENENPMVEHNMIMATKDLLCGKCNDKVGLKLITKNADGTVIDKKDLLLVNKLVVFNGREGPQPQLITEVHNFVDPQADPLQPPPPAN